MTIKNNQPIIHLNKRYVWQDHCKGLAILLVVLGHMLDHENIYHGETIVSYLIYGFHMPLFFLMSGYTLHINYEEGISGFYSYVQKHAKKVLLPGILFTLLEFVINSIHAGIAGKEYLLQNWYYYTNIENLYHTLTMDSRSIIPQYWFFPALFSAMLLIWWILYLTNRITSKVDSNNKKRLDILCQIALIVVFITINIILKDTHIVLPLCLREAMLGVAYVWLGYILKKVDYISIKNQVKVIAIICFALIYTLGSAFWYSHGYELLDFYNSGVDNMPLSYILGISGSFVVILLYMTFDGTKKEGLRLSPLVYAGKNSIWVYGFHFFFLEFWFWFNNALPGYRSLISVIVKLVITVAIMILSLLTACFVNWLKHKCID